MSPLKIDCLFAHNLSDSSLTESYSPTGRFACSTFSVFMTLPVRTVIMSFAATRHLHYAVHIIRIAAFGLNLNRCVRNLKIVFQLFGNVPQHVLSASYALLLYRDVTTTTDHS